MKKTVQYLSLDERDSLIAENSNLMLVEEQNITEGNFLTFSDFPLEKEIVYINVPQERLDNLDKQLATISDTTDFLLGM